MVGASRVGAGGARFINGLFRDRFKNSLNREATQLLNSRIRCANDAAGTTRGSRAATAAKESWLRLSHEKSVSSQGLRCSSSLNDGPGGQVPLGDEPIIYIH